MDLGEWLKSLGLGQYGVTFREHEIDADVLPDLTEADLEKIGLPLGARKRLMKGIAGLASNEVPPSERAPGPGSETSTRARLHHRDFAERRTVTVMFCDLVGSTSLVAKLDAEDWRNLVNAYQDEASKAVTEFGGHVQNRMGDGLMALFGYPEAQENDAERAVRASLAILRSIAEINARNAGNGVPVLSARVGLELGSVVVDASGEVFGEAPNIAARVQAVADPGSVLVTRNVQLQVAGLFAVEDQGPRELKGISEPVSLYRVVRASGGGRRSRARLLAPFVGRDEELGLLVRHWERVRGGEGQLLLIVGEPGLGKSRLIDEFHTRLSEVPHTWVEWGASQLLQNTPLHPVAEWGRLRFGTDGPAEKRLADLEDTLRSIGLDHVEHTPLLAPLVDIPLPPPYREATFVSEELRRRQLAALVAWVLAGARSQPVVLVFEDLQWADPTSLDLLRALVERGGHAPLFLIATSRPGFRPSWGMRSQHTAISLAPLKRDEVYQMVREIASDHALSKDIIEGVSERTGGVPLFIEEVTRLILDRGAADGVHAIPPTLQQSLAARLDRLGSAREVAQISAVLGREFAYPLLRDVAELDEPALQASLERLADADLLFVSGAPPQSKYRFKHALVQDAAYESLLKTSRQTLHRHAAEVLIARDEGSAVEPEVTAHHFTQAGLDDLALEWWGKAGEQALRRSAFQEAISHLGKAIEMADKADEGRPRGETTLAALAKTEEVKTAKVRRERRLRLQTTYGAAMSLLKGFASEETKAAIARAAALAGSADDFPERYSAMTHLFTSAVTEGDLRSGREMTLALLREAEDTGRIWAARIANWRLGMVAYWHGDFLEARDYCERALEAHDPNPDPKFLEHSGHESSFPARCLAATMWQLGEVERARTLIDVAVQSASESGRILHVADALFWKSYLEIWRGDPLAALRAAEALQLLAQQHGMTQYVNEADLHSGWARGRIGEPEAGAAQVRRVLAAFVDQGVRVNLGLYTGLLAELEAETLGAESALARIDEAFGLSNQVEHRCSLSFLHRLRGNILRKRDSTNSAPAEEAFLTAITIAMQQSARSPRLLAALALTKLHESTGRTANALAVLGPALAGFSPTSEMPEIAEAQAMLSRLP